MGRWRRPARSCCRGPRGCQQGKASSPQQGLPQLCQLRHLHTVRSDLSRAVGLEKNAKNARPHDTKEAGAQLIWHRCSHPLSAGKLKLPFQRPHPECRTFHSDAIEDVIQQVTSRIKDPDLARLFENAFPSTTDTTVKFHSKAKDRAFVSLTGSQRAADEDAWNGPQSFVITGDIIAEWLRDSTNQLRPYQELAAKDPAIYDLILGAINTQAEYVIEAPYCNAFQPPPISDLPVSANGQDDVVSPAYEPSAVFECKYELDSLAHFLKLGNDFYDHAKSSDFVTKRWLLAIQSVLSVLKEQSQPTFDKDGDYIRNRYTFQRTTSLGTETLNLAGVGNPLNAGTGLVRSAFRPSDDATILGFFIPANAMMSVELGRAAAMLKSVGKKSVAAELEEWSKTIREGVMEHGIVEHKLFGKVFAYEVDGFGSSIIMDDANYPSLLALPLMGFVDVKDPIYQNTRKMLLSKKGNPYYLTGAHFNGIGGEIRHRKTFREPYALTNPIQAPISA